MRACSPRSIATFLQRVGRSGHIGFNEPGSGRGSRTRLIYLDTITRKDAAADFFGEENVPAEAITMGVATILEAREIALIATGEHKALIVRRAVEGDITDAVAASFLPLLVTVLPRQVVSFPSTDRPSMDPAPVFEYVIPYATPFQRPSP